MKDYKQTLRNKGSDEWATPQDVYQDLDREFHFDLDPCSSHDNHKCSKYYTIDDDGLSKNWGGTASSVIHRTVISSHGYASVTRKGTSPTP